ncbi:hypothetical protein [Methylosinus sporium]|uniref:hypothetical protein n=1 Tax=Methylosinus sporium TaxID=428 RepID=UPI00383ADA30
MRLIVVAGPPSVGKTAIVLKTAEALAGAAGHVGVVKFDSLASMDEATHAKAGLPAVAGLAGSLCPDH